MNRVGWLQREVDPLVGYTAMLGLVGSAEGLGVGWVNDRLSVGIGIESVVKVFDGGC